MPRSISPGPRRRAATSPSARRQGSARPRSRSKPGSGATGAAAGFFNGVIDEVRIWNVARTQQQIQDGMSGEILSAPNLLGRWGLNENSGTSVADSSGHGVTGTIVGTPLTQWNWVPGTPFN